MAELEAELEVRATYLLMTESVFYNLERRRGCDPAPARARARGRAPRRSSDVELDDRFDRVVSWHNPKPEYMSETISGAVNVYAEPYFSRQTYRSDSNQHWRSGCPHEEPGAAAFRGFRSSSTRRSGCTPARPWVETMRAMVEAESARRLDQLAADGIHVS